MTLEEAMKRIADCMKQSTDDYNRYEDNVFRGEAYAYKHALEILDEVDAEPVENPEQLTLKEFMDFLRKLFHFRWLTVDKEGWLSLWVCRSGNEPPRYTEDGWTTYAVSKTYALLDIIPEFLRLDLSEYTDEDIEIDYSKCIVEVTDASE